MQYYLLQSTIHKLSANRAQTVDVLAKGEKRTSTFPAHGCPGDTSRRFYARVLTKFQDNTIISLGGKSLHGNSRSQALADEMADGRKPIMLRSLTDIDLVQAFLGRASHPVRIDDSEVMAVISIDDVCGSLKRLKRGKAAGPDELNNSLN